MRLILVILQWLLLGRLLLRCLLLLLLCGILWGLVLRYENRFVILTVILRPRVYGRLLRIVGGGLIHHTGVLLFGLCLIV